MMRFILTLLVFTACDTTKAQPDIEVEVDVEGVIFVRFKGGSFEMTGTDYEGSPENDWTYPVTVPAFQIMRTMITVAQYRRCVEDGVCEEPYGARGYECTYSQTGSDALPVNCLTWVQAAAFAQWFGHGARLPSEVEWMYAASNGGENPYPWGDDPPTCDHMVVKSLDTTSNSVNCEAVEMSQVLPVCSRPLGNTPAPQSLCDILGNVVEFVADDFHQSLDCELLRDSPNYALLCEGAGAPPTDGSAWINHPPSGFVTIKGSGVNDGYHDRLLALRGGLPRDRLLAPHLGFRLARPDQP